MKEGGKTNVFNDRSLVFSAGGRAHPSHGLNIQIFGDWPRGPTNITGIGNQMPSIDPSADPEMHDQHSFSKSEQAASQSEQTLGIPDHQPRPEK